MRALRTYGCFDRTDGKCVIAVIALGVVLAPAGDSQQAGTLFHQLPLYFVENRGQVDEEVLYYLVGRETGVYFAQRGVTYALTGQVGGSPEAGLRELPYRDDWVAASRARWAVKLDFLGTDLATVPQGESPRTAVVSYFKGSGANQTGISTFKDVTYRNLWPGIDLTYSGTVNRLKYRFTVHPGSDPKQIRLAYRGADVVLNEAGQLGVSTPLGGFRDDKPYVFQQPDGREQVPIRATYALDPPEPGDRVEYGFELGDYDPSLTLIMDGW